MGSSRLQVNVTLINYVEAPQLIFATRFTMAHIVSNRHACYITDTLVM